MPNPWDVGSARLLASCGFEALATTSAGLRVVDRQARPAASPATSWSRTWRASSGATSRAAQRRQRALLPRRSRRCRRDRGARSPTPERPGSRSRTTTPPPAASTTSRSRRNASPRSPKAAHRLSEPMVLTGRAENHIRGVDDLDDTIARLIAYRDAGADVVYAPGLHRPRPDRRGRRGGRRSRSTSLRCRPARPTAELARSACGASRPAACWPEPPTAR